MPKKCAITITKISVTWENTVQTTIQQKSVTTGPGDIAKERTTVTGNTKNNKRKTVPKKTQKQGTKRKMVVKEEKQGKIENKRKEPTQKQNVTTMKTPKV